MLNSCGIRSFIPNFSLYIPLSVSQGRGAIGPRRIFSPLPVGEGPGVRAEPHKPRTMASRLSSARLMFSWLLAYDSRT